MVPTFFFSAAVPFPLYSFAYLTILIFDILPYTIASIHKVLGVAFINLICYILTTRNPILIEKELDMVTNREIYDANLCRECLNKNTL